MLKIVDETTPATTEVVPLRRLRLARGEALEVEEGNQGQRVRLLAPDGAVIFTYDSRSGKAQVRVPEGDLELVSEKGDIDLVAARDIRLHAERVVEVRGDAGAILTSGEAGAERPASVKLLGQTLRLDSELLHIVSGRGDLCLDELSFTGKSLRGVVREAKVWIERYDLVADRVRQRARSLFQTIDGLWHTRAERGRAIFSGSYHQQSRSLSLRAEREAKIDGDQVLLG